MLRLVFDPPKFGVSDEVKDLLKKPPKPKKDTTLKFWTHKERVIVGSLLVLTIMLSIYFWYQGQNKTPNITLPKIGGFSFTETIEVR